MSHRTLLSIAAAAAALSVAAPALADAARAPALLRRGAAGYAASRVCAS